MSNPGISPTDASQALERLQDVVVVGAEGAAVSVSVQWLSRKVEEVTGLHLGKLLHLLTPTRALELFKACVRLLQTPVDALTLQARRIYYVEPYLRGEIDDDDVAERGERLQTVFDVVVAPVAEEVIYRGFVQKLGQIALQRLGVERNVAKAVSIIVATLLFGLAHTSPEEGFDSPRFNSAASAGAVMAKICDKYGLNKAIVAHILHNLMHQVQLALRR